LIEKKLCTSRAFVFYASLNFVLMNPSQRIRQLLVEQLSGGQAHIGFKESIDGLLFEEVGVRPQGLRHSIWELAEHIRIAQHDILDFSRNSDYKPLSWPDDYWPKNPAPADHKEWENTLDSIEQDREQVVALVNNPANDLLKPLEHGDGQTLFREAMLIVDHNAYHIGQIVQVRRVLGCW
jgi:hypothetical protein